MLLCEAARRVYLRLEVDPMLECLLVVQRDPQIVPIINEVVLCFPRHFRSGGYSTRSEEVRRSTESEPGWLTDPRSETKAGQKLTQVRLLNVFHRGEPFQQRSAATPPVTGGKRSSGLPLTETPGTTCTRGATATQDGRQACFPDFSCAECMEEKLCGSCLLLPRTLRPH